MTLKSLALETDPFTAPRGKLVDAFIEAMVLPRNPPARAAALSSLVYEMALAVEWRHASDAKRDPAVEAEVLSVRQLAAAVEAHQARMIALGVDPAGPS